VIDLLANRRVVLLDPATWDDRNDSYFLERYKILSGCKSVLALCLSSVGETYHHWRVFCGQSSGVCVEYLRAPFVEHLNNTKGVRTGDVQYKTLGDMKKSKIKLSDLPFLKRHAFRHESEYRAIYESAETEEATHDVKIPLSIIRGITLSPGFRPLRNPRSACVLEQILRA
jgi:hypothetical protein